MDTFAFNLTTIAVLWLSAALFLLPIAGMTARFALVPLLETWMCMRRLSSDDADATARLAALEAQVEALRTMVERRGENGSAADAA